MALSKAKQRIVDIRAELDNASSPIRSELDATPAGPAGNADKAMVMNDNLRPGRVPIREIFEVMVLNSSIGKIKDYATKEQATTDELRSLCWSWLVMVEASEALSDGINTQDPRFAGILDPLVAGSVITQGEADAINAVSANVRRRATELEFGNVDARDIGEAEALI